MRRLLAPAVAAVALALSQTPSALPVAAADPFPAASSQTDPIPFTRIVDHNAYSTAATTSERWSSGVDRVYIANSRARFDAMVAAGRVGVFNGPLLFTAQDSLPPRTRDALKRLSPRRVVVVGGAESVSDGVLNELAGLAGAEGVERMAGADRYATAAKVAMQYRNGRPAALLVNGTEVPNAAVSALAANGNLPIVLTRGDTIDSATMASLRKLGVGQIIAVGDPSHVSDRAARRAANTTTSGTYRRIDGSDPYQISAAIAREYPPGGDPLYVTSGEGFHGAYPGAALAGRDGVPLILTPSQHVPAVTEQAVDRLSPTSLAVFGGSRVVSEEVVDQLTNGGSYFAPGEPAEPTDPTDPGEPAPSPERVSTGMYNGMGANDDQAFLDLVGDVPLTHAVSYYTAGEVNDYWPKPLDRERLANGATLLLDIQAKNWQGGGPNSFMAWPDIAAGKHDAEIRGWGRKMADLEEEIWFAFDQEPAVKMHHGKVPASWTPEDYAAATRRISRIVRTEAPNVKFTFWVGGSHRDMIERAYPGDDAVDIICWDPYVHGGKSPDLTPYQLWSSFSTWLDSRSWGKGKTRGLCETGFDNRHPDEKGAAFWKQAPDAARRLDLAFVTLFHRNSGPLGNYTMENMPLTRRAYAQAMRDLQN